MKPFISMLKGTSKKSLQSELDRLVALAIDSACTGQRGGIRVTRLDYDRFLVETDASVPFGQTLERDLVRKIHPNRTESVNS